MLVTSSPWVKLGRAPHFSAHKAKLIGVLVFRRSVTYTHLGEALGQIEGIFWLWEVGKLVIKLILPRFPRAYHIVGRLTMLVVTDSMPESP